ncbi:MAG: flagellar basal body-associated FliL family protein [Nitrospinae bacterium]|nr:flagellar basal body-associated FliL family protein [Nitrospinota bacterium]
MADEAAPEGKSKKGLFIIIAVVLVLLLAGGGGAAYFFLAGKKAEEGGEGKEGKGEAGKEQGSIGEVVELPPFIVNLAGEESRYLKVVLVIQVSSVAVKDEVTNRAPQIKDAIITVLSSKEPSEILTVEGKYELKLELVKRINQTLTTGVAKELFFVEFVVQ